MIVTCPSCQTVYNLPDEKLSGHGAKVRCSRCSHVFQVEPDELHAAGPFEDWPEDRDEAAPGPVLGGGPAGSPAGGPEDQDADDGWRPSGSLDFGELGADASPEPKRRKGGLGKFLLLLLLLVLLAAAGLAAAYFGGVLPANLAAPIDRLLGRAQVEQPAGQPTVAPEAGIELENVRQYIVNNDKAGQLLVIEGQVVNGAQGTRGHIQVEAALFDNQGGTLAKRSVRAGEMLTYFQLQILPADEIRTKLDQAEAGEGAPDLWLAPGEGAPFMVVFFQPPAQVAEFGIKVIGADLPPQK